MSLRTLCLVLPVWSGFAVAQDPVDDEALLERIEANCAKLRADGRTVPLERLREGCDGRRAALELVAPTGPVRADTVPPRPRELRRRLLRSTCIVGHHYRCEECRDWHFSASTGFAVGKDGAIATCYHLLVDAPDMPDATLVVADWTGAVYPVTEVLAADRAHDLCVLRCTAALDPLPFGRERR